MTPPLNPLWVLALCAPCSLAWADGRPAVGGPRSTGAHLDPLGLAHRYARSAGGPAPRGVDRQRLEVAPLELVAPLERRWAYADLVQVEVGMFVAAGRFWRFDRGGAAALVVRLQRWQRRLAFRFDAAEAQGGQETFAGLDEVRDDEHEDYGRTFAAANGSLRGDLTLVFGNTGSTAGIEDVQQGRASVFALNPFREVGAQFDFTILEDAGLPNKGILIFRVRAAYLGLFDQLEASGEGAGVAADSQAGLGIGIKW